MTRAPIDALRYVAFYLPQFHPIPENDEWWGAGFTEWRNVARGDPLFRGHEQPHMPGDLGFYDLRLPETRQAQADLAARHGIDAFCYFHYWFDGRRLLERPFDEVLALGRARLPVLLCAGPTRTGPGRGTGSPTRCSSSRRTHAKTTSRHVRALAEAFADPRYLRIDGRPVFLVYRAFRHPRPREFADMWRTEAQRLGLGDLYLCAVNGGRDQVVDPDGARHGRRRSPSRRSTAWREASDTGAVARASRRTLRSEQPVRATSDLRLRDR